jgi:hypothetical protein
MIGARHRRQQVRLLLLAHALRHGALNAEAAPGRRVARAGRLTVQDQTLWRISGSGSSTTDSKV